jgi:nicotinate-nucleotide pyrophosphorylase (carboxylating)
MEPEPEPQQLHHLTDFASLLPQAQVDAIVQQWVHDDMPSFDVGGLVVGDIERQAVLWMKSPGIVAGKPFFDSVFRFLGCTVEWSNFASEGTFLDASSTTKMALAVVRYVNLCCVVDIIDG